MFNSKKNEGGSMEGFSINSLGTGSSIKGDIVAKNDIRIDGNIIGNITCDARIIIGESGKVDGNVTCNSAIIQGKLTGNITIAETLEVHSKAIMEGEITTNKLIVENGAVFNVRCSMGLPAISKKN